MKKILSVILVAVMLLSMCLLTGCQEGQKPSGGGAEVEIPEVGYDGSEVTIVFYHTMGESLRTVLDAYIAEFNKLYPNITIQHEQVGGYDDVRDQIKTELTTGAQPNIAYCYPDHVAMYNLTGKVLTLDNLIASQVEITRADGTTEILGLTAEQIDDFIDGYYNEGKSYGDGKMYTMPLSKSTEVLYYNKTFFDKHELEVPTTWEELEALCAQIKTIEPNCIPLGYDSEANWFITMCEQYGSDYTDVNNADKFLFNNETNRNFVKMFREWFSKKWVTTEALSGGYTSALFTGESDSGTRCYMCIGSTGGATYQQPNQTNGKFEFEVGIATIPQVNPEQPKVISQGPSICIFKNADPQEVLASWLFVKFLTTDVTFQGSVSMNNGYAPVIKSVKDNPAYAEFLAKAEADGTANIQAYAVKVALDQADAYYVSDAFNGSSAARDQVGLLMQKCLSTEAADVDAFIKEAFEKAVAECKYQAGM